MTINCSTRLRKIKRGMDTAICVLLLATSAAAEDVKLPFESSKVLDAILVTVRINGKPAVLIFDTGSNCTILSPEVAEYDTHKPNQFQVWFPESGAKNKARWGYVSIEMAGLTWKNRRVVVKSQQDISELFQQRIDGILGKDVLNEFRSVTIDLKARFIRFSK